MKVTIDISEEKFDMIQVTAKELGLKPEQLMQSFINDQMLSSKEDFEQASSYVLEKNKELYDRLA